MKKRTVIPARLLWMYEANGWKVHMTTVQRPTYEKESWQVITYSPDYRKLRLVMAYTPEHARQAFTEAKHYVAVEIAKVAMGINPSTKNVQFYDKQETRDGIEK